MQTLSEMLHGVARFCPAQPAIVFQDSEIPYGRLDSEVSRLANGLRRLGLRPGDRVMTLLPNGPELVACHFGIIRAGGTAVPLNVMSRAHELLHIGADTSARAIIAHGGLWEGLSGAARDLDDLRWVVTLGEGTGEAVPYGQLLESPDGWQADFEASLDDVASIIYTSGTTGRPKGATQTHRSILSSVQGCWVQNKFSRADRLLCALPLFNNFALNVVMMSAVWSGTALIVVDRFDARKVLDHVKAHRATYFAGTPTMFTYLLGEFDPGRDDVSSLRVTNSGGARCPTEVIRQLEERFGVVHLDGYGQTEACGFTTLNPLVGVRKADSVGPPLSNLWVSIHDDDDRPLPPGEVGEVVERGDPFSIHGYWNQPDANQEVYRRGWFHSGDLGYLDEDGYLYIVDRKQDLIITGGANIYPAEVEEILYQHPKVALAALVGIPDEVKGELAKAYIVLKPEQEAAEGEIIEFVRARIAKYKAPRMVEFVDALPLGPTGKILKREIRARQRSASPPPSSAVPDE